MLDYKFTLFHGLSCDELTNLLIKGQLGHSCMHKNNKTLGENGIINFLNLY